MIILPNGTCTNENLSWKLRPTKFSGILKDCYGRVISPDEWLTLQENKVRRDNKMAAWQQARVETVSANRHQSYWTIIGGKIKRILLTSKYIILFFDGGVCYILLFQNIFYATYINRSSNPGQKTRANDY